MERGDPSGIAGGVLRPSNLNDVVQPPEKGNCHAPARPYLVVVANIGWLCIAYAGQMFWSQAGGGNSGIPGAFDGVWLWNLPRYAEGLRPSQDWMPLRPRQTAMIYVTGMDHRTNAALYRVDGARVSFDSWGMRSASEAVGSWKPGEIS